MHDPSSVLARGAVQFTVSVDLADISEKYRLSSQPRYRQE